jgi:hypothetical protein
MNKMNSKGQIAKLISLFPIMILVFIIMGVFVVLSVAFSPSKPTNVNFAEKAIMQDDLMLKTINVEIDGKMQEMRVIDAVAMCIKAGCNRGHSPHNEISAALIKSVPKENSIFIFKSADGNSVPRKALFFIYLGYDNSGNDNANLAFLLYHDAGLARTVSLETDTGRVFIVYYAGGRP